MLLNDSQVNSSHSACVARDCVCSLFHVLAFLYATTMPKGKRLCSQVKEVVYKVSIYFERLEKRFLGKGAKDIGSHRFLCNLISAALVSISPWTLHIGFSERTVRKVREEFRAGCECPFPAIP